MWPRCPDILGTYPKGWRNKTIFPEVGGLTSVLPWMCQGRPRWAAPAIGWGLGLERSCGDLSPVLGFLCVQAKSLSPWEKIYNSM